LLRPVPKGVRCRKNGSSRCKKEPDAPESGAIAPLAGREKKTPEIAMKDSPIVKILLLAGAALALLSMIAQHQQAQLPFQQLEQMNQQNEQMNQFLMQQMEQEMEQEMNNPLLTNPNGYPGVDPWQEQPQDDDWVE
jgi:single-stranded DNA-specific DHH superfamily exonuclease